MDIFLKLPRKIQYILLYYNERVQEFSSCQPCRFENELPGELVYNVPDSPEENTYFLLLLIIVISFLFKIGCIVSVRDFHIT